MLSSHKSIHDAYISRSFSRSECSPDSFPRETGRTFIRELFRAD
jgi:hypothetical protein